jgi:cardiolipin synthase
MSKWVSGNKFTLLENGEAFFPRVFDSIAAAREQVVLETFILFEDKVGKALHARLLQAAARGVQVDVTIDGYGSPDLSPEFLGSLAHAGVRVHVFEPGSRLWGWRTNVFRRMHRKIVVIDGERAFVGGINYAADHLADFGPEAKQDYAVEIEGPLVAVINDFVHRALRAGQRNASHGGAASGRAGMPAGGSRSVEELVAGLPVAGKAGAIFVTRDNRKHTTDIEKHYRIAIRSARHRVVIANAYFFPGYLLLREMRRAARRGVQVSLILQGEPDMPIVKTAAGMLYHHLIEAGVRIFEYQQRPLHGKVAMSDDLWATVGSSNLDPLSLSLNLEANVIIRDSSFNQHLYERLSLLINDSCREVVINDIEKPGWWSTLRSYLVFHLLRHFPAWAAWLPAHAPRLVNPAFEVGAAASQPSRASNDHPPDPDWHPGSKPATTATAAATSNASIDANIDVVSRADPV